MSHRIIVTIDCDLCDRAISWTNPRRISNVRAYARRKGWVCGILNNERFYYCPDHASTPHSFPFAYLPEGAQPYNRGRKRRRAAQKKEPS